MIYLTGVTVFVVVILVLTMIILALEKALVKGADVTIIINDDPEKSIHTQAGKPLLFALSEQKILLPSACGGKGACGMCKCLVEEGGGDLLPTELSHLSRKERKSNVRIACQMKVRSDLKIRVPESILSIKKYQARVVSNDNVATFIKLLILKLDDGERVAFKAGNYMQIDVPPYALSFNQFDIADRYKKEWERFGLLSIHAKSETPIFRAYSLANPPLEQEVLTFTIRIATPPPKTHDLPPGVGSSFLFHLKPGDQVTLSGPYGEFFVKESQREMCFIGGGAGMAPMRSHILDQLEGRKTQRKISFWYGARSRQEMFFDEEFQELAHKYPHFSYHVALSEPLPEDHWEGLKGFIHQCLYDAYLKNHEDPADVEYYLCGPPMMIDAILVMLDSLGVDPEMIAYDKF